MPPGDHRFPWQPHLLQQGPSPRPRETGLRVLPVAQVFSAPELPLPLLRVRSETPRTQNLPFEQYAGIHFCGISYIAVQLSTLPISRTFRLIKPKLCTPQTLTSHSPHPSPPAAAFDDSAHGSASNSLGNPARSGFAGVGENSSFNVLRTCHTAFPAANEGSSVPTPGQHVLFSASLDSSCPHEYKVLAHCCFDVLVSND